MDFLLLILSIFLAVATFRLWISFIQANNILPYYIVFLFPYLGFILLYLSFFTKLTNTYFIITQIIILSLTTIFILIKKSNFKLSVKNFLPNQIKIIHTIPIFISLFFLMLSLTYRMVTPIIGPDEKSYRAATPIEWVNNRSIFRFESPNSRQNVFLMGTGYITLWSNLFSKIENHHLLLFWSAFPLLYLLIFYISKELNVSIFYKTIIILLISTSPIIFHIFSETLMQEIWLSVVSLSAYWFLFQEYRIKKGVNGYITGFAFGILPLLKNTYLISVALLLSLSFIDKRISNRKWNYIVGCITAFILSGYLLLSLQNYNLYNNPFGPEELVKSHKADLNIDTVITYFKRLPFIYFSPPLLNDKLTEIAAFKIKSISSFIGASKELPRENELWVGNFEPIINRIGWFYGLLGCYMFIVFIITLNSLFRSLYQRIYVAPNIIVISLLFINIFFILITTRWVQNATVPYRHLIAITIAIAVFSLSFFQKSIGKYLYFKYLIFFSIIFISLFMVQEYVNNIIYKVNEIKKTNFYSYFESRNGAYNEFLRNLKVRTSMIMINDADTYIYPFYYINDKRINNIYIFNKSNENLLNLISSKNYQYLIIDRNSIYKDFCKFNNTIVTEKYVMDDSITVCRIIN